MTTALVIGGGVFGLVSALELAARGVEVTVLEPGPLPHPLAESTDVSKVVRMDYGADAAYTELAERALVGWRRWNTRWPRPLFHETGVTFLARSPLRPGGFEHDSLALLVGRGHPLERLDAAAITARFPAYRPGALVDGYFNPRGGWAASGAVVTQLAADARAAGIAIREGVVATRLVDDGVLAGGALVRADLVVVCAGAWVPRLVPELASAIAAHGQPVFHLAPADPAPYAAARFPVFGADLSRTGYYGFPATADGLVKIANHGAGVPITSDDQRVVGADHERALRALLADVLPGLAAAPIVHRRLCVYADTRDGHFWIARHPARASLVVATGGSGHAFKFAPVLGALVADAALGEARAPRSRELLHRFRWRPELARTGRGDAARADR